ncbi:hypothetical protein DMC47_38840 [Nostoc sp. 3335mG]|nr:hypothetical protein DMC47_38840 [Nostoc sp. 3335mG]
MARPTRTYKLKVSPEGFDLIVDSHARLVRATRTLLPYGLALHTALHHLDSMDNEELARAIFDCPRFALGGGHGGTTLFVGAPRVLADVADRLVTRLSDLTKTSVRTGKADIYLVALRAMLDAEPADLLSAYGRVVAGSHRLTSNSGR